MGSSALRGPLATSGESPGCRDRGGWGRSCLLPATSRRRPGTLQSIASRCARGTPPTKKHPAPRRQRCRRETPVQLTANHAGFFSRKLQGREGATFESSLTRKAQSEVSEAPDAPCHFGENYATKQNCVTDCAYVSEFGKTFGQKEPSPQRHTHRLLRMRVRLLEVCQCDDLTPGLESSCQVRRPLTDHFAIFFFSPLFGLAKMLAGARSCSVRRYLLTTPEHVRGEKCPLFQRVGIGQKH